MKLTGKVTLITNVSQFMGPACTEEFAKEGATLALHDRTEARAKPARLGGEAGGVAVGDQRLDLEGAGGRFLEQGHRAAPDRPRAAQDGDAAGQRHSGCPWPSAMASKVAI